MLAVEIKTKLVDERKVREWMSRKNIRSLEAAVKVVRKFVRSSIKRRSGRKKTYDLEARVVGRDGKVRKQKMSEHLRSMEGVSGLTKVVRGRDYEANPRERGEYIQRKGAPGGGTPYSWKARQAGWKDHWLKNTIKTDVDTTPGQETGIVYVSPHSYGKRDKTGRTGAVPQLLEFGGSVTAMNTRMIGYHVTFQSSTSVARTKGVKKAGMYKRRFNQVRVKYSRIWSTKTRSIRMQARPFLGPGLAGTLKDIPNKWR